MLRRIARGIPPTSKENSYLSDSMLPVIIASTALGVATLGFTLFGEALRDAVDPRLNTDR